MRRYWISSSDKFGDKVSFHGEIFHHVFDVCRQGMGSKFEVLTQDSKAYLVEVTRVGKKDAEAAIIEERIIPPLPAPHIHIALAISRFPVMDAIMEKAVEMGVYSIQPFFSEFSFMRQQDKISQNKFERWDKIVKSATQQSGRGSLMKIHEVCSFKQMTELTRPMGPADKKFGIFAYEGSVANGSEGQGTIGLKEFLQKHRQQLNSNPTESLQDIWIIVGSEGGFSHHEVETLSQLDLQPVTLGSQVLRVETACIALVSALKYEFELLK